jgi:HAD superfamily hydrolase (TIGR01490 family)
MTRLALFDLDNTLLGGDSDHAWGEFLVEKQLVDGALYKEANDRFFNQYKDGTLDIQEFLSFTLRPLTQHAPHDLVRLHTEFMQSKILPLVLSKALDLIESHRQHGDKLIIITATNRFVTAPIASHLNIDTLLASEPEIKDSRYTGRLIDTPCYREGKVTRLHNWLKLNPHFTLQDSYFYSDSHNDIPLLSLVDNPVAVDADEKLTAYAKSKNWPLISLR